MSLDTRSLNHFVRVAEAGSISRAAKLLHIAQPALSTSLSNLEDQLNVKLFQRSSQGVKLTHEGQCLLAHAERILGQIAAAEQELRQYGDAFAGPPVTVGLIHSVAGAVAPKLFTRLQAKHPKLSLRFISGLADEITEGILSGDIDCAVLPQALQHARIQWTPLFTENLYLFSGQQVDGLTGDTITFERALQFPLLSPCAPSWARHAIYDMAVKRGLHVNVGLETDLGPISPLLVAGGELFMIATWSAIHGHEHALKGLKLVEPEIQRVLCLARPNSRSLPPSVRLVSETLEALMHELKAQGMIR